MRTQILLFATAIVLAAGVAIDSIASDKEKPVGPPPVERRLGEPAGPVMSSAYIDTFTIASFTFDSVGGGADPEGWAPVDVTDQPVYFHIDNFAGMPTPWGPLAGSQSMWLGVRASAQPPLCGWANPPGYGNDWRQELISSEFAVTGDVDIAYEVRWDSEPGYDLTYLQYRSDFGPWAILQVQGGINPFYSGSGQLSESIAIPAANHTGTIQFRFLFVSDGGVSDEDLLLGGWDTDGAIVIDDLVVTDQNGVVDSQDFEQETIGDSQTLDGDWIAGVVGIFGNYGALFDGTTVVQEDPSVTNTTNLWGFFSGSTKGFECGGFPGQLTVPLEKPTDLPFVSDIFIRNEARSPVIDITKDENDTPMPPGATVLVSFDVYRDLPLDPGVRYRLRYRSFVDGCPGAWSTTIQQSGADKLWLRQTFDITSRVDPAATEIQIALLCYDVNSINDPCHTHSPLFDNVQIDLVADLASGVGEVPTDGASLRQNVPNPFNPTTTIRYHVEEVAHVRLAVFSTNGARVRTLVDGMREPRAGGHEVVWDGRDDGGRQVASGIYFYRLTAGDVVQTRKMLLLK